MDRSKPTLLSLTLYIGDERESPEIQDIWNTVLASNSNRWRSLHLGIFNDRDSDTIELHPLFQAITGRLESLQHLSITAIPVEVELEPRDLFSVCPSLNSIALECVDLDTLALPHSQIRSLTIRYGAIDDDFATLFPNVEHIVLEDLYCPYDPSDPERQICCSSKVRSLTVTAGRSCEEADEIFNPFRTFTLPGLSSLGITDSASDFLEDWKTFDEKTVEHFLIRSRCSITHFLLKSTPITDGQAIKVIGLMPTLQSLHIENTIAKRIDTAREIVDTAKAFTNRVAELSEAIPPVINPISFPAHMVNATLTVISEKLGG
ncbi:hypothetical protein VNI00_016801 [Paramarasmius palmivorus]|uniref:Uncharacterized protein n=1 Tax=Paramarasmius palmivorus TaxID=297713 RepID=A0AAW0BD12_9AGAR